MITPIYVDDLKTTDREDLIAIIASGADYPYWYKDNKSKEDVAEDYMARVKRCASGESPDLYKAVRVDGGRMIGCVYLEAFDKKNGQASVCYFLHQEFQGQGIGKRAVFDVVRRAVAEDGLQSLNATVHPKKIASQRILMSLGLIVTGYITDGPHRERDGSQAPRVVMEASAERLRAALESDVSAARSPST